MGKACVAKAIAGITPWLKVFFHSLETECVLHERYQTREQAQASIFDYIEVFYNRKRRRSANNQMSPANVESYRNVA